MKDCPLTEEERLKLDVTKIHNEINILVNIRMLVSLGVMPLAGLALMAWNSYKVPCNMVECFEILFKTVGYWLVVVALYFIFCAALTRIRLYAAYLRIKRASDWEEDWYKFRFCKLGGTGDRLRNSLGRVDLFGFASIFHLSFYCMVGQCVYMLWYIVRVFSIRPDLVCDGGCFGVHLSLVFSLLPLFFLAILCVIWVMLTKRMANVMSETHENELIYIWCLALYGKGKENCGDRPVCDNCAWRNSR
jgi:hypothetical protein